MSKKTQILTHGLLSGEINGAALQGALENGGFLGAWLSLLQSRDIEELLRSPTALSAVFNSPTAFAGAIAVAGDVFAASEAITEIIVKSSSAIATVVQNPDILSKWTSVPANKARLSAWVNASGSKLRRALLTSSGSVVIPAGSPAQSVCLIGSGGRGSRGDQYYSGSLYRGRGGAGGGGGAAVCKNFEPHELISGTFNVTITSGNGNATNFGGGLVTAANGTDATNGDSSQTTDTYPSAGVGGGSDNNPELIDADSLNAIWQYTASKRGGYGGASALSEKYSPNPDVSVDGNPGGAGLGPGGNGGQRAAGIPAQPGQGLGGGGGSSAQFGMVWTSPFAQNASAPNYGAGGGGNGSSNISGSSGMTGCAVIHWVDP